ncbi:MAG: hypothetical protein HC778_00210 [Chamaesiphon sp. CSU_1_12]|nr:hypothetical protein [Chamaesiphon sp. CSU_1_12]
MKPLIEEKDLIVKTSDDVAAVLTITVDEVFKNNVDLLEERAKKAGNPPNSLGRSANYITASYQWIMPGVTTSKRWRT